jgi:hypothetical protein
MAGTDPRNKSGDGHDGERAVPTKLTHYRTQGNRVNEGEADDQPVHCHCEERSDAAIPTRVRTRQGIASLRSQ